ncbi:VWA domain-containing protein [Candidatus Saccharibacteria bacterium]|nr:VWA domain-containing protein [Candidatus Saccharibacteria bacterium]
MRHFGILKKRDNDDGFVMATVLSFLPLVSLMALIILGISMQAYQSTINQELIREAQLASIAAMEYAKEQYEVDQTYTGTPETLLYSTDTHDIKYEIIHKDFSNTTHTQQDIQGIGRVYKKGSSTPLYVRETQGKITYTSGSASSVRFIFIIDNSGSMSTTEWLDSKGTVDAAINYVLDNVSSAQVAVVQYGTNHYSHEHKYDITVPFTNDKTTATTWDRRYGPGSSSYNDLQDHLPASLARMRLESVYGPGDALDLVGATDIQYVIFTDGWDDGLPSGTCCSHLKTKASDPASWFSANASGFSVLPTFGEYNAIKDGTVFSDDGYPGLTAQFTILNINNDAATQATSAAIASPGGTWNGAIDANAGDPEGNGILPRRFISTSLSAGPTEILSILQEIIDDEINF